MREPPRLTLPPVREGDMIEPWMQDAVETLNEAMAWIKEAVDEIKADKPPANGLPSGSVVVHRNFMPGLTPVDRPDLL